MLITVGGRRTVLVGIAVIIRWVDAQARNGAWTRIAAARHTVWRDEQQLRPRVSSMRRRLDDGGRSGRL